MVDNRAMTDRKKPGLRLVKKSTPLTIKQQAFVSEIVKGKLGSYKAAYAAAYDVTLTKAGKVPVWVEVEASKLVANPKIALSIRQAIERREQGFTASALRTKNYVIERLFRESQDAESDASRVRSLELLGKTVAMFSDVVEDRTVRDSADIERDIEAKLEELLADAE